jgi:gluconokinase
MDPHPDAIILMGVSGAGKSSVGRVLAERLGWLFVDGDDLHSTGNVEKMRGGEPLSDEDRAPWLAALRGMIAEHAAAGRTLVLACSALKRSYREQLAAPGAELRFVYLRGGLELIRERLQQRAEHYMPAGLLESQFDALEEPASALRVEIDAPVETLVDQIVKQLGL